MDFLYRLATVLEKRLNHEYWCEPECTWQTNSINKTATKTSERLDSWACRLWRGIELVFKSLHCFTMRPIFSTRRLLEWRVFHFLGGGVVGWGRVHSSNAFTIWCCIPISRTPRVIRRFKRRSCVYHIDGLVQERHNSSVLGMELYIFLALTHRYYDVLCFKQYYLAYGSACHCKWLKAVFDLSFCLEALTNDF